MRGRHLLVLGVWAGLILCFAGLDYAAWTRQSITGALILTGIIVIICSVCSGLLWELAHDRL